MIKKYGKPVDMGKIRSLQNEVSNSEKTKKACTRFYKPYERNESDSVCRLCGSNQTHLFFKSYGEYLYYECDACGGLYLANLPDVNLMYSGDVENACGFDYYGQEERFESRISQIVAPKIDFVLDVCKQNNVSVKRWLDIGAGCGHLLSYIKRAGIQELGYESDKNQFDYMINKGLNVKNLFLDDQNLRGGG